MDLTASIRRILLDAWDPLGVRGEPAQHGRYDCVVEDVHLLLLGGADDEDIAACLRENEARRLGMGTADEGRLARVVMLLQTASAGAPRLAG